VSVIKIEPLKKEDFAEIIAFCDRWIGVGYFNEEELEKVFEASFFEDEVVSFVARSEQEIAAIRLTFAPGTWDKLITTGLSPNRWSMEFQEVAYFKSLFVADTFQAQGLGRQLSEKSMQVLRRKGAKGILCHSWLESPHNSSVRYLEKFGFKEVCRHQEYWKEVDYLCIRCAPGRCLCTAVEMLKELE